MCFVSCICFTITCFVKQELRRLNFNKDEASAVGEDADKEDGYKRLDEKAQP